MTLDLDNIKLFPGLEELKREWPAMKRPPGQLRIGLLHFNNTRYGMNPPIVFQPGSRRFPAPPTQDPLTIFRAMINLNTYPGVRWVKVDPTGGWKNAMLFFVDGAASNNGTPEARGGCGVVFSPQPEHKGTSFPLEKIPGEELTSNRAELRAAVGALSMRRWAGEGFETIVVGTDSEYMVKGVNEWVDKWRKNGWKTSTRKNVKNKDLWVMLVDKIEEYERQGIAVQFYLMERRFNKADAAAKRAAVRIFTSSGRALTEFFFFRYLDGNRGSPD